MAREKLVLSPAAVQLTPGDGSKPGRPVHGPLRDVRDGHRADQVKLVVSGARREPRDDERRLRDACPLPVLARIERVAGAVVVHVDELAHDGAAVVLPVRGPVVALLVWVQDAVPACGKDARSRAQDDREGDCRHASAECALSLLHTRFRRRAPQVPDQGRCRPRGVQTGEIDRVERRNLGRRRRDVAAEAGPAQPRTRARRGGGRLACRTCRSPKRTW